MGLLFQTPVELRDIDDRTHFDGETLTLRSYGLPMVFWLYFLAFLTVLFFMVLAIKDPLIQVLRGEDTLNRWIGIALSIFMSLGPLIILGFYFYEKEIKKQKKVITITHKVFSIPFIKKSYIIDNDSIRIDHFIDGPNVAALEKKKGMEGFENRGYFKLMAKQEGRDFLIDRNGRRGDMRKLKELLENY